ncbi:hypothetical protein ACFV5G_20660 [Streptomyces sp. NPDC059766]|uniref:hypothetical protein n=1 Tax=Streptomyces sp. NPDC059766 TaxID=3346940 RepID=UPI0036528A96
MTSTSTEVEPAPVFVDRTGQRGRRLRGFGWLVGIVCTGCVVAMISGLIGTQSQAPALKVPGTANTTPPGQYLDAPLPAAPGAAGLAEPAEGATATATGSGDTASGTTSDTASGGTSGTTSTTDGTAASGTTASDATASGATSGTATTTDGTAAANSTTVTAQ